MSPEGQLQNAKINSQKVEPLPENNPDFYSLDKLDNIHELSLRKKQERVKEFTNHPI
jgi:hypothetical protein